MNRQRMASDPRVPVVVGVLLAAAAVVEVIMRTVDSDKAAQLVAVYVLLALSTTLPLAVLRPTPAAVAVSMATVFTLAFFNTLTVAGASALLFTVYRLGRSLQLALILTAPYLVFVLAGPRPGTSETSFLSASLAALAPMAALTGIARRARQEAQIHSAAREAVAGTLVEHTARGERARIARELHDVVAHHISMVAVQAETARLTTPGMPAAGAQRLSAIGDTARDALTEMRRLLGVLREDTGPAVADLRPQPGLGQLIELLDESRDASGTAARLIFRGPPVPLDPGVELAAYRIVQEALTNARRHAPGSAVDVEVHYTEDSLRLRIRDNGPGPVSPAGVSGHGLLGMRERATAVGGELRSGAAPGGGFLIEAELPTKTETSR